MANLEKTKSCNTQRNSEHNSVVDSVLLDNKNYVNWNAFTTKRDLKYKNMQARYIPLTNSYGPSFFPLDLWPKREARGP